MALYGSENERTTIDRESSPNRSKMQTSVQGGGGYDKVDDK